MVGKVKKIFMIHLCNWIKHLDTEEVEEAFCRSAVQTEDSCRMGGGEERWAQSWWLSSNSTGTCLTVSMQISFTNFISKNIKWLGMSTVMLVQVTVIFLVMGRSYFLSRCLTKFLS